MENDTIYIGKKSENEGRKLPFRKYEIKPIPAAFIIGMHLGCIGAFFYHSWAAFWLCIGLHVLTGGVGITLCYHRLLTHKSFTTPRWLTRVLATIACLACQGGPISWVSAHRMHHAKSDEVGDPHSPRDGFFWSHMGWCLSRNREIDVYDRYVKYAPDLAKDPYLVFLDRWHVLPAAVLMVMLYFIGGLEFVFWGTFVRTTLVYHSTWSVNSAAHVWGYKNYDSKDDSTNLWWVALMTYGEGWHNNHHAFQTSARHGLKPWEIDVTYWMIKTLAALGLADNIKLPSTKQLQSAA